MNNSLLITGILLPPGINTLLRMHWAVRKKKQKEFQEHIVSRNPHYVDFIYNEPVEVVYVRKSIRYMDWDNAAGSFKLLGDILVALEIIPDDNPSIIERYVPLQEKVSKRIEQGFTINIHSASAV
jgi:hypothetical protein|tara:strand:- start:24 stop:398 length:375 start_codon:yes stop_codon:yes gene_type:complete